MHQLKGSRASFRKQPCRVQSRPSWPRWLPAGLGYAAVRAHRSIDRRSFLSHPKARPSELSKSCEKRLILPNVAYFVVFAKSPPFFFFGGPF